MTSLLQYPHIHLEIGKPPRLLRSPRVRVAQIVMDHLGRAWPADEIVRQYSHVTLAEVHSALAYYFDHSQEIDREIQSELRQADSAARSVRQSPLALRLAALAHSDV
jgi:uncharacterized protein (DUF433 family)